MGKGNEWLLFLLLCLAILGLFICIIKLQHLRKTTKSNIVAHVGRSVAVPERNAEEAGTVVMPRPATQNTNNPRVEYIYASTCVSIAATINADQLSTYI